MGHRTSLQLRAAALAAATSLAFGLAACGSSDDGDSNGGSDARAEARQTVEDLYAALRDSDAEGVCAQLNRAAQRQIEQGGQATKGDTCAESFQKFLDSAKQSGGLKLARQAKIEKVEVKDDRATATVSFGGKGRTGEIPLKQVDGQWKVGAAGASPSN